MHVNQADLIKGISLSESWKWYNSDMISLLLHNNCPIYPHKKTVIAVLSFLYLVACLIWVIFTHSCYPWFWEWLSLKVKAINTHFLNCSLFRSVHCVTYNPPKYSSRLVSPIDEVLLPQKQRFEPGDYKTNNTSLNVGRVLEGTVGLFFFLLLLFVFCLSFF